MIAQKKMRSLLATATAALLVASGAALAPTAALAAEPATPTIELSKTQLKPEGDTLTVTGSGFDTSFVGIPGYYGCPSFATAPKGFYVQVGWIKDTWKPSEGGVSTGATPDRKGGPNTWFADGDLNCRAPSTWTIEADGTASFEYTVEVTKAALGVLPEGARYAVFTHGGAGTSDQPLTQQPVNELSTDISFYPATVTGSVADSSPAGLTVSGAATGIPAGITGAYAAVIEEGDEASLTDPDSEYIAFAFPPFPAVTDGATSFTMTADAAKLDRNKRYEILVWKQHAAATPENIYGRIALDVSEEQWDDVFGMPTTTTVKFSPSTFSYNVKKTATVTVKAERSDEHPTGAVRVKINGKNYDATLANGKAAIQLSTPVNKGTRAVNATFTSDSAEFAGSKGSTTVVVTKATPKVSAKLAKSKVTTKQNGKIKVAVTIPGSLKAKAANFKVKLYDGKKVLRTVTLSKSGTGNVTIPKLKKGTHKIKVTVLSTTNTNSKSSVTRTLKVVS
ncbi:Ig-like domain-containing protein [Leucobacter soli]|uniref:Ig-like domain-containing protein n=1 Tax=Leucobacter soli TaxID=2812850 RepID=A0A916NWY6_9MICO|nr:Ig-like domain-containing protein [Leucobacter soli]CAG7620956.1 hypothetical protein LEUCIP111803_02401 [Leucobacter soli]